MLGGRHRFARDHRLIRGRVTLDDPPIETDPFASLDPDLIAYRDGFDRNRFPPRAAFYFSGLRDDRKERLHNAAALLKAKLLDSFRDLEKRHDHSAFRPVAGQDRADHRKRHEGAHIEFEVEERNEAAPES